ncbi:MAG: hypothetical protein NXI30_10325 [bacterium]|nr:hypothetical protein [bacterium]
MRTIVGSHPRVRIVRILRPGIFARVAGPSNGEALDDEERIRSTNHHATRWGLLDAEWIQREIGTIGGYAPRPEVALTRALASPTAMEWREAAERALHPDRFLAYVDQKITEIDLDHEADRIEPAGLAVEERSHEP